MKEKVNYDLDVGYSLMWDCGDYMGENRGCVVIFKDLKEAQREAKLWGTKEHPAPVKVLLRRVK